MHGHSYIYLPRDAERFTNTMPEPNTYSRAEIDDMVHGFYRAQKMSLEDNNMTIFKDIS